MRYKPETPIQAVFDNLQEEAIILVRNQGAVAHAAKSLNFAMLSKRGGKAHNDIQSNRVEFETTGPLPQKM